MYNAHGQVEKYSKKEYPVRKRMNFETSQSYNRRVGCNSLIVLVILIIVIGFTIKVLF